MRLRRPSIAWAAVLLVFLCAKFLLPALRFDVPLGYDAGMYRYLFLRYAEAFPFDLPDLLPWAKEHPIGLFLFSSLLVKVGVSPDILIGWLWNTMPVVFAACLASIVFRRHGALAAIGVLLFTLLSQPLYDGFVAMYWKTLIALLFAVFAYDAFDRRSALFYPLAFLSVITHHQTGLIVALATGSWWFVTLLAGPRDAFWRRMTVFCTVFGVAAFIVYLPQWERAVWSPLKSIFLLRGDDAPGGSFPDTLFYVRTMAVSILFGAYGFVRSMKERWTLWHYSVFWCAIFIVFRLVFYRRFFLQLDVFLLPFAGIAFSELWQRWHAPALRTLLVLVLSSQAVISLQSTLLREPAFTRRQVEEIVSLDSVLPDGAAIIALENVSGPWLLGWLPDHAVGAPGLFDLPGWTYEQWELFLYGTNADRESLLSALHGNVYFYLSQSFLSYYGDKAEIVLRDPCLKRISDQPLLHSVCTPVGMP